MEETGIVRFRGNLNPTAQEFRPQNQQQQITLISPPPLQHPQFYFPYTGGVSYHHNQNYPTPPAFVSLQEINNSLHLQQQPFNFQPPCTPPLPQPLVTPSRTLLLSSVPKDVNESTVRKELKIFGDIRAVQMERAKSEGIVTVHFYDLRDAQMCLTEIREQHMKQQCRLRIHYNNSHKLAAASARGDGDLSKPRPVAEARGLMCGEAVWAQFVVPIMSGDWCNQGTIVLFNLDSSITTSYLKQVFDAFGPVKELRETPSKRHQKFVEFYDVRDAAKALKEMNGKELNGHPIVIEFSRPGGQSKRFFNNHNSSSRPLPRIKITEASSSSSSASTSNKLKGKIEDSMASLCVTDSSSSEGGTQISVYKKSLKKGNNHNQQIMRSKSSKGRYNRNYDSHYLINEDAISESNRKDPRTTVMIKNIPNKYSQKLILNMLDNHCIHCNDQCDDQVISAYDFLYLPIDFNNKCNVGYGFVNMTTPEATRRLYKAFHQQSWEVFNSRKICEVSYARVQGLEALKEHFKNSKFPKVTEEEIFPVVFSPPRDGTNSSQPIPIFGHQMDGPDSTTPQKHGVTNANNNNNNEEEEA